MRKRPRRLNIPMDIKPKEILCEEKRIERRERKIDLSKYTMGFDEVTDKKKRTPPPPSGNKALSTQYNQYLKKLENGDIEKFSTRDILFYFRDIATENGVKYIIANPKIDMKNFKTCLSRGYSVTDILSMIEFLFTSGQKYLDTRKLHPGILLTNWCNTIFSDTQLWLEDKYNPEAPYGKTSKAKQNLEQREWSQSESDNNESSIGAW